ncbi:MAG: mannose-1-phosphate guanylyltransferase/mannose-6-phosphate isomerase [Mariprofundaceae bacterium]|nr:mannose-1-phosphate guanylyltransferase/mannose-6-phosphate isomerase [Mariprofundaceae bacterium]
MEQAGNRVNGAVMDSKRACVAVILAGGSGTRLWPLSRQQLPKQFLNLKGDETLLGGTISRLHPLVAAEDVWVVTSEALATGEAYSALSELNTILEPVGRNTAPAIAVAAALLMDRSEHDPVMLVLPADHLIQNVERFHTCLGTAINAAEHGALVTFGIEPTRPDTGFGYIQADRTGGSETLPVIRFAEKPDLETAESFLAEGGYYWNSGMFVWKASTVLDQIKLHMPDLWTVLETMRGQWKRGEPWQEVIRHGFAAMPSISIDYGVMEKSDRVVLVPCDIGWSDVGSWDAVYDISDHDENGNALAGDVLSFDCKNSLIRSESKLLAAVDLEDVIVVETPDAILLTRRGESQRVREIVDVIRARGSREHIEHRTVMRPWGSYTVLEDHDSGYKLKKIEVNPGASLSLQSHRQRSEHWVVVSGTATVTRGEEVYTVSSNESTFIPIGTKHRLANDGKTPLQIVEVQVGDYLGEDDIERFDDSYGRSCE